MMALQAIALLAENLTAVYEDSSNIDAWDKVALANTLGGMAIDASGTTLPHGLEHPVVWLVLMSLMEKGWQHSSFRLWNSLIYRRHRSLR